MHSVEHEGTHPIRHIYLKTESLLHHKHNKLKLSEVKFFDDTHISYGRSSCTLATVDLIFHNNQNSAVWSWSKRVSAGVYDFRSGEFRRGMWCHGKDSKETGYYWIPNQVKSGNCSSARTTTQLLHAAVFPYTASFLVLGLQVHPFLGLYERNLRQPQGRTSGVQPDVQWSRGDD